MQAHPDPPKIAVRLDTDELERQVAQIRLCLSQIGFALDGLLVNLRALTEENTDG